MAGESNRTPKKRQSRVLEDEKWLGGRERADLAKEKAKRLPKSLQKAFLRAASGVCGPRQAIKAFCLECVGYVRAEVENCSSPGCPLFAFRPYGVKLKRKKGLDPAAAADPAPSSPSAS